MYGDAPLGSGAYGELITVGVPIIFEVTLPGKELLLVVEIDLIEPAA